MDYLSPLARGITPYVAGEQPQDKRYIKINTNENPYPPSPRALAAMAAALNDNLRLYPDPVCTPLAQAIARAEGLQKEQIYIGNGSDEVLAVCFQAFYDPAKTILFPDISYSFYPVYAALFGIAYERVPLDGDFTIQNKDYQKPNGGILFPNPNAPTGIYKPLEEIEELCQYNLDKAVVIVDEAYIAFGGESARHLLEKYPNLLIVRTLSKSHSLAGLRVGYALGSPELIEGLERIKNSFNSYVCDRVAMAGAAAAIADDEYYSAANQKVISTRERVTARLRDWGFSVLPSKANFVFATRPGTDAKALYLFLKERGVLVRYFAQPRIDGFLRITIGTDEEMDIFLNKMQEILSIAEESKCKTQNS